MSDKATKKSLDEETFYDKKDLLEVLFRSFRTGINSKKAEIPRDYLEARGLDFSKLEIGFNSGQFHHRKDEAFRKPFEQIGVLTKSSAATKESDMTAYTCFGSYGIIFPLKDKNNHIVNLYAIRIKVKSEHAEYLNTSGIYPHYPHPLTKRLFITPTILDAASVLQSGVLENRDSIMALDDGKYKPKHYLVIECLQHLEEVIIIQNFQGNAKN